MAKLLLRVPKGGGKPEHWAHISTNAQGPTHDAEGLLALRQPDATWHRHVPHDYPGGLPLRVRLRNKDWPDALVLAQVLGTPAATYTMIGTTQVDTFPAPPASTGAWISQGSGTEFYDGSDPIRPHLYTHNPFETENYYPNPYKLYIPDDPAPYYADYDPGLYYPAITPRYVVSPPDPDPTTLYNGNGALIGPAAFSRNGWLGWHINPGQVIGRGWAAPFYLFPERFVARTGIGHALADLRWVRTHTTVPNIQAVEIIVKVSWNAGYPDPSGDVFGDGMTFLGSTPVPWDPYTTTIVLSDATGSVPVHEARIQSPGVNFYASIDPNAMTYQIGGLSLTHAREEFESFGDPVQTWAVGEGSATPGTLGPTFTGAGEFRVVLPKSEFDETDYVAFGIGVDAVPAAGDKTMLAPFVNAAIDDILVALHNL